MELTMEVIFDVVALSRVVLVTMPAPVTQHQTRLNLKPVDVVYFITIDYDHSCHALRTTAG